MDSPSSIIAFSIEAQRAQIREDSLFCQKVALELLIGTLGGGVELHFLTTYKQYGYALSDTHIHTNT